MGKVIDYRVVIVREDFKVFEKQVKALIADGWEPQGGLGVDPDDYLYQAMVKRESEHAARLRQAMAL